MLSAATPPSANWPDWLGQLAAGTATQATVVEAVLESAEHIADGDVYQVTNNTYNTSGTYTLDHTTDTAAANAIVQNLYETALGQAATASGLATYSAALLNGTMTETQIAAALIGTSQFLTEYGSLSSADFVSQIFVNGLFRQRTAAEAAYWTGELNSGAVSQADLVAAMARDFRPSGNSQWNPGDPGLRNRQHHLCIRRHPRFRFGGQRDSR